MFVHDSKPINRKLKINQSNRESKVKTIDFCNEMEKMILSFLHLIIVEDRNSYRNINIIFVFLAYFCLCNLLLFVKYIKYFYISFFSI